MIKKIIKMIKMVQKIIKVIKMINQMINKAATQVNSNFGRWSIKHFKIHMIKKNKKNKNINKKHQLIEKNHLKNNQKYNQKSK